MCPMIDNPTRCEICAIIRFLHTTNVSATEIHCELCAVYGKNVMSEGTVLQWCRIFKHERKNVHDGERSGRPSVVSDDLVQNVDPKILKYGPSKFQNFRVNFHKCSSETSVDLQHGVISQKTE
jgi:hypothetical protein